MERKESSGTQIQEKQFMKRKAPDNPPSLVYDRFMLKKFSDNEEPRKFEKYAELELKQEEFKWRGVEGLKTCLGLAIRL